MNLNGSCHCKNIRYQLTLPKKLTEIPVRSCCCNFCKKHAAIYTSAANSRLLIEIKNSAQLLSYKFGTKTAEFCCCALCGNLCYVLSKIKGKNFAVINTNLLANKSEFRLINSTANFNGESLESRLARREQNWISEVDIVTNL